MSSKTPELRKHLGSPMVFDWIRVAHLISFLCFHSSFLFVCPRSVSCSWCLVGSVSLILLVFFVFILLFFCMSSFCVLFLVFGWIRVAHLIRFLCFHSSFLFVCPRSVSCSWCLVGCVSLILLVFCVFILLFCLYVLVLCLVPGVAYYALYL